MDALLLTRMQCAVTSIYHFFFLPLTLGLSVMVAVIKTRCVRAGNVVYRKRTIE